MKSIQNRLTTYLIAGSSLLLLLAGLAIDQLLRQQLETEFDKNLLSKLMTLVSLTEQDEEGVEFDFVADFMPEFAAETEAEYFQMWLGEDNAVFSRSESLDGADLPLTGPPVDQPRFADTSLPDGRAGRLVELTFIPRIDDDSDEVDLNASRNVPSAANEQAAAGNLTQRPEAIEPVQATIVLARGKEELDKLLASVRTVLSLAFIGLMTAIALLSRFSVSRGLKPLRQIAREVRGLDTNHLSTRIQAAGDSVELSPIVAQLNNLLDRMEKAFEREKRFSGNVAHELRTPIAELRAMSEVGREWPDERELVQGFFGDLVNLADDMERTVSNLLMLARLDAGEPSLRLEVVNLAHLVRHIWERLEPEAKSKGLAFRNDLPKDLQVHCDQDKLTLILINILSNAISYSPRGSEISISAEPADAGIRLLVSNPTEDLSEPDLEFLFERFWRKDTARSGRRHAGLGLSLVKALAEVLNLKIKPVLESGPRFTMSLSGLMPS